MKYISDITRNIKNAEEILNKYSDTSNLLKLDAKDSSKILYLLESSSIEIRKWVNIKKNSNANESDMEELNRINAISPINVIFENTCLRIFLPYTDKNLHNGSVPIADYVSLALKNYEHEHGFNSLLHKIKPPYFLIVRKYNPSDHKRILDNDNVFSNYEISRVINVINEYMMNPDDWQSMKYVSVMADQAISENFGVEIVIFEQTSQAIRSHINDLLPKDDI